MSDPDNITRLPTARMTEELIPNPWAANPRRGPDDVSVGLRADRAALARLAAALDPTWNTPLARLTRRLRGN